MAREFNPQRLTTARQRRGLTKIALADALEMSSRTITQYENGKAEPSPKTLGRMADCLRFPLPFFCADDLDLPAVEAISFRALSKMSARERDRAQSIAGIGQAIASWTEQRFDLPQPQIPRYGHDDPTGDVVASVVRREWGLGEHPISNMLQLLEAKGVRVFSLPHECSDVDAFSFWQDDQPYVFLDAKKSAERRRFDAAHELGHLVMHWRGITRSRQTERLADDFGSAFLMPRGSVIANQPRNIALPTLIKAKKHWGVSVAALVVRMHRLGLLTDWQYRTLFIQISRLGYRGSEPDPIPAETSHVWPKVFELLNEDGYSFADTAAELLLDSQELRELVIMSHLTVVSTEHVGNGAVAKPSTTRPPTLHVIEGKTN